MDSPNPRHHTREASFFGAMAFLVFFILMLSLFAALGGCDRPLTNQEVAEQTAFCKSHGLKPMAYMNTGNVVGQIVAIQCAPKDSQ